MSQGYDATRRRPCKTCGRPTGAWQECKACIYARRQQPQPKPPPEVVKNGRLTPKPRAP